MLASKGVMLRTTLSKGRALQRNYDIIYGLSTETGLKGL